MKFYLDAHISRVMWEYLVGLGHDCAHAGLLPPSTSDEDVLRAAVADGRVVVTADKDFGELVFRRKLPSVGVVLLRLTPPTEAERFELFKTVWPRVEASVRGYFVVVTDRLIRRTPLMTDD